MAVGDIALVGYGADSKSFAFVLLADMSGQTIFFTDNGWTSAGSFRTGEGVISVTIPAGLPVGSVVTLTSVNTVGIAASAGDGTPLAVTRSGSFDPSASGDAILAYTGSAASPDFLFGVDFADGNSSWSTNATSSNTSAVPTGLTAGSSALAFGADNGAYTGPLSGTRAQILANLADPANWTQNETAAPGYPANFSVDGSGGNPGALSIGDATLVEGDSGETLISFTVTRAGGSSGAVSADYALAFGSADASDFGAGQAFSGTVAFAAGQISQTITFRVAGDTANEVDDSFTVSLANPTGGATIADGSGAGTIVNDDAAVVPGTPFINEIHYDNASTDSGEAIEIAAPAGTNLSGWSLVLYSVSSGATQGTVYSTIALGGIVSDQDDGYGTLSFAVTGLQNGAQDGVALVNASGEVVQFLSYEGAFTAANGVAAGLTSTDIGVAEDGSTPAGFSLQLVGSGANAADFEWVAARDDNFGSVNTGQDFLGVDATGLVSIGDVSIDEGDSGVRVLTFTVERAGGLGQSASVDWAIALNGTADAADFAGGQPFSGQVLFGEGVSSVQIQVAIAGDATGEANESFAVQLTNPVGNIAVADGAATGTILNDDPISLKIYEIQGAGHSSAFVGQPVETTGIVTGVLGNGFYLQDPTGDANAATSDAIFVYTGTAPSVAVGDGVLVRGTPTEFGASGSLSLTELEASQVTVQSSGNALPAAVVIGVGGLLPPTEAIEDDGFATYDPATSGMDFWESLEGMRVTIDSPTALSQTNNFGETYVVASNGVGSTGFNSRGGLTISDGDFNPERIQIDATSLLNAGYTPAHTQGDKLSDVTGILSFSFDSYEVLVTEAVTVVEDVTVSRETTDLAGDRDHLTVASYNLENLDPTDSAIKFDLLASNIVYSLGAPDIIAVQEIQDGNGLDGSDPLSGTVTAQMLIDAIAEAGGPTYIYVEVAPETAGSTGGEPGGNIRNGYFYNPERVSYVTGSAQLIEAAAFDGSRKPLIGEFLFNGQAVQLINVHFTSRLGSDPLWGSTQPPNDAGDAARTAQAAAVSAYVNNALATDPSLNIGVLGDFNGFYFEDAIGTIEATGLTDLHRLLPEEERYSYLFDGNLQAIDHMIVSGGLWSGAQFDAVHINAEQAAGVERGTDHDPIVGRFFIEHPNEAPLDLELDGDTVDENAPAGTLVGVVAADDPDGDTLAYALADDADGLFAIDAATGALTTTAPLDHETADSYQLVVRATDPDGLSVERTVTITVGDVNEAPTAGADQVAVAEDATSANLWNLLLANDSDPDAGAQLSITGVDTSGTLGSVVFDAATQTLRYVADNDAFDALPTGSTATDSFTYTLTDGQGLTRTATVTVQVQGVADSNVVKGGNGWDLLNGNAGENRIDGGNGNDWISGGAGHDWLFGGNGSDFLRGDDGNDVLSGGNGIDILEGGQGADIFRFGKGGGADLVLDFDTANDRLLLDDGVKLAGAMVLDVNFDGEDDLTLVLSKGGGTVTLFGVDELSQVQFATPADVVDYWG